MAEAKKCDICGAFYDHYNGKIPAKYPNFIDLKSEAYDGEERHIKTYDCCPKCMYEIAFIIEMIKTCNMADPKIVKDEVIQTYNLPEALHHPTIYDILKENLEAQYERER